MTVLKPSKLTVRIIKRKLGDHFLDFMNAHNPNGYLPDDDKEIDEHSISGMLIYAALESSLTEEEIRSSARKMYTLSRKRVSHGQARRLLAIALGYSNWTTARAARLENGAIVNLRLTKRTVAIDVHSRVKGGVDLSNWPLEKPLPDGIILKSIVDGDTTPCQKRPGKLIRKRFALNYNAYVELTEQLRDAFPTVSERLEHLITDYVRNVLPGTTVVWVTYDQGTKGRFITYSTWIRLALLFKKAGGLRALCKMDSNHPLFVRYEMSRKRVLTEPCEFDDV